MLTISFSNGEPDIILGDEEVKSCLTDMLSVRDWMANAISEKARRTIDLIIQEHSDRQPKKISKEEKATIIKDLTLETARERNKRIENEMRVYHA